MAALAGEKLGLQVEEPVPLTPPSAAVSPEGPVAGDDPTAGDDEPDRIPAARAADYAGGARPPAPAPSRSAGSFNGPRSPTAVATLRCTKARPSRPWPEVSPCSYQSSGRPSRRSRSTAKASRSAIRAMATTPCSDAAMHVGPQGPSKAVATSGSRVGCTVVIPRLLARSVCDRRDRCRLRDLHSNVMTNEPAS